MSTDLVPVEAHLADVLAAVRPMSPVRLGLEEAEGGVLTEDAAALCPLPPFDNSAMDGYAVRASDVAAAADAPVVLPVAGQVPAGDTRTLTLAPGTSARIMTGALLPAGADAVVPVEWTDGGTERVAISQPAPVGHAIRRSGDDVAEGDVMVAAGTLLGHELVRVRPRPLAAVVATGDELTDPGSPLKPGRIWDSNSYMLAAAVRQAGGRARRHRVKDDLVTVVTALEELSASADLLITSGGVSMGGEHDAVKAALTGYADVTFRKVAMQPGMPQGFGVFGPDRTPVFTLPGNPVSTFVSFQLFVRPVLQALQGLPPVPLPTRQAILAGAVRSPEGRRSFLRGVLDAEAGRVVPLIGQASHQLGVLARANALIVVPEQTVRMEEGEQVDVVSLP